MQDREQYQHKTTGKSSIKDGSVNNEQKKGKNGQIVMKNSNRLTLCE